MRRPLSNSGRDPARPLQQHPIAMDRRGQRGNDPNKVRVPPKTAIRQRRPDASRFGDAPGILPRANLSQRLSDFLLQIVRIDETGADPRRIPGPGAEGFQPVCRHLSPHRGNRWRLHLIIHKINTDLAVFTSTSLRPLEFQFGNRQVLRVRVRRGDDLPIPIVADQRHIDIRLIPPSQRNWSAARDQAQPESLSPSSTAAFPNPEIASRAASRSEIKSRYRAGHHDSENDTSAPCRSRFCFRITSVRRPLGWSPMRNPPAAIDHGIEFSTIWRYNDATPPEQHPMRTTIALDDDLVAQAQAFTGLKERSALIRAALTALIERESARRLANLGGSEPKPCSPPPPSPGTKVILIDTSVWVDHLRRRRHYPAAGLLQSSRVPSYIRS